ncbi:MAG: 4Fe-4S binding protein [Oscillospiraceae bacterium]|nr:4Fe-4S binding protein [Oscillospiraceae bacterium]
MANCLTLKKSNCKSCYKCIRHCPVKAIRFSGNQAYIIGNECILCGQCFVVCPQNAKEITSEIEKVKMFLQSGVPVVVSLAPSFVANYEGAGIGAMKDALKKLGFYDVEETAMGATVVKNEYERMLKEDDRDVLISSCCHSVNLMIQKHYPQALEFLADVVSPMQAHCKDIKSRIPEAKTVFIGPCVAKKDEAEYYEGIVDAALTFEELTQWLKEERIEIEKTIDSEEKSKTRVFPTTGGVLRTMAQDMPGYTYIAIDGVENCEQALKDIIEGKVHKCFIEMSACVGSCVGGPIMEKHRRMSITDTMEIIGFAGDKDFEINQPKPHELQKIFEHIPQRTIVPSEFEIMSVLRQMGKTNAEQELNCSSCGYNTCREKAIAVCQGKAEISMCMPFLKHRAESFSDNIVKNTPNGIIVLNDKLEVQQINDAACRIMNIKHATDVMGDLVVRILDPISFMKVLTTGQSICDQRVYLAEYKRYIEQTIFMDRELNLIIGIMRDVTEEETQRRKKEDINQQTLEIADQVVDKQMRIVQEIAYLLGETAAETKIALSKLKESIANE